MANTKKRKYKKKKKSTERVIRYDRIAIVMLIVLIAAIAIYLISEKINEKKEKDIIEPGTVTTTPDSNDKREESTVIVTDSNGNTVITGAEYTTTPNLQSSDIPAQTQSPGIQTSALTKQASTQAPNLQVQTVYPAPPIDPKLQANGNYVNGILIANKSYPLPEDYSPGEQKIARAAFDAMQAAAKADGIKLWIKSGFRSYSYQKQLYDNYVKKDGKEKADTYSARPGHSEHQTGLSYDINTASSSDNFQNTKEGKWLAKNSYKFGFILRYPNDKINITGYKYEPWHFRYVGSEVAKSVFDSGKTLEEYLNITSIYST
ncbi:MAG: M15 family metallopeptidase [Ruminococcus sp.]|jgi:LAS superfamily LD-carboxypeptidase LdcB|nr:M15 family metallopeptidase [Ruminococcus sp.]